jgi:hypothetical protein
MNRRWLFALWIVAALIPLPAFGQTSVDVGVQAGVGCQQGRDRCTGAFVGPAVGVNWRDRVDVRIRALTFEVADRMTTVNGVATTHSDIMRRLIVGDVICRFFEPKRIQLLMGISVGTRRDSETAVCVPGPCPVAPSSQTPESPRTHASTGLIAGIGFRPTARLGIEGWVGLHDIMREEGGTGVAAVLVTLRLWRSR